LFLRREEAIGVPPEEKHDIAKALYGVIVSYQRGQKTQKPRQCLISFPGVESVGEAGQLIGRKVAWPVGERKCRGKIVRVHGRKGLVRARFIKGIPGKALGSKVEIIG
jgi:large subunit ribosomal protein L35Ae